MTHYYFDTSALVKHYIFETGTRWIKALIEKRDNDQWANVLSTSSLTWAEMISAFSKRYRSKDISPRLYTALIDRFLIDGQSRYSRLSVNDITINLAVELIQHHPLRAYDAVQLATALRLDRMLQNNKLSPITFVSADTTLCQAAAAEGLAMVNPNEFEEE